MLYAMLSVLTKSEIQNYFKEKNNLFQVNRSEAVGTLSYFFMILETANVFKKLYIHKE